MKTLNYILARLSESSTWRGGLLIATALGCQLEPDLQNGIMSLGLSAIGVINLLRKEKK